MSLTSTSAPTRAVDLRRPALQLCLTLAIFVAYLVTAIATIAQEAKTSADLTPGQLDDLGIAWVGLHVLWVAPPLLAALALTALARRLGTRGRVVPALAVVTAGCAAAYLLVNVLALGSEAATWGQDPLYPWSVTLSLLAGWAGCIPATVLVAVGLARRGIARRTSWAVAALMTAYGLLDLLTYLPILLGPDTLAGFLGGLPPFLLGVLWAVLGGGLLRARVPSQE